MNLVFRCVVKERGCKRCLLDCFCLFSYLAFLLQFRFYFSPAPILRIDFIFFYSSDRSLGDVNNILLNIQRTSAHT